jgi:hypothetical protein
MAWCAPGVAKRPLEVEAPNHLQSLREQVLTKVDRVSGAVLLEAGLGVEQRDCFCITVGELVAVKTSTRSVTHIRRQV